MPPSGTNSGTCESRICELGEDQHRHTLAPPGVMFTTCHDNHTTANTCQAGQHVYGHDSCHDGPEHACASGQYMKELPTLWAYSRQVQKFEDHYVTVFSDRNRLSPYTNKRIGTLVTDWEIVDSHTGCYEPLSPFTNDGSLCIRGCTEETSRPGWLNILIKPAIEATGDFLVKTIDTIPGSDVINLVLCAYPTGRVLAGTAIANRAYITKTATAAQLTHSAFAKTNLASAAFDLALDHVYCPALQRADDETPTTTSSTTTTTTVPPTTTTTTTTVPPPSLPEVARLPRYDRDNFKPKTFPNVSAVPGSCTPWVYWRVRPGMTLLVALCRR